MAGAFPCCCKKKGSSTSSVRNTATCSACLNGIAPVAWQIDATLGGPYRCGNLLTDPYMTPANYADGSFRLEKPLKWGLGGPVVKYPLGTDPHQSGCTWDTEEFSDVCTLGYGTAWWGWVISLQATFGVISIRVFLYRWGGNAGHTTGGYLGGTQSSREFLKQIPLNSDCMGINNLLIPSISSPAGDVIYLTALES